MEHNPLIGLMVEFRGTTLADNTMAIIKINRKFHFHVLHLLQSNLGAQQPPKIHFFVIVMESF